MVVAPLCASLLRRVALRTATHHAVPNTQGTDPVKHRVSIDHMTEPIY
jgi:hypothetical protein